MPLMEDPPNTDSDADELETLEPDADEEIPRPPGVIAPEDLQPGRDEERSLFRIRFVFESAPELDHIKSHVQSMFFPIAPGPTTIHVQTWEENGEWLESVLLTWNGVQRNNRPLRPVLVWDLAKYHRAGFNASGLMYEIPGGPTDFGIWNTVWQVSPEPADPQTIWADVVDRVLS